MTCPPCNPARSLKQRSEIRVGSEMGEENRGRRDQTDSCRPDAKNREQSPGPNRVSPSKAGQCRELNRDPCCRERAGNDEPHAPAGDVADQGGHRERGNRGDEDSSAHDRNRSAADIRSDERHRSARAERPEPANTRSEQYPGPNQNHKTGRARGHGVGHEHQNAQPQQQPPTLKPSRSDRQTRCRDGSGHGRNDHHQSARSDRNAEMVADVRQQPDRHDLGEHERERTQRDRPHR